MGRRVLALSVMVVALVGCGSSHPRNVAGPFVPEEGGGPAGPISSAWGDGPFSPAGSTFGCIDGRRLTVAIGVTNQTKQTVTLTGSPSTQLDDSISRVAVQFELLPKPTAGNRELQNLPSLSWSRRGSAPLAVPAHRGAWVVSSLLMSHCSLIASAGSHTVDSSIELDYRNGGGEGTQVVVSPGAQIALRRGPIHPTVPINHTG